MHRVQDRQDSGWQAHVVGHTPLRPWLQERGSLTARLKKQYPDFAVQVLSQGWRKPNIDERVLLRLPAATHAWVREVMLMGEGQPQVFAHSVIARKDLRGAWCQLRKIGRVPLGAALFANASVQRGRLYYRKLSPAHPLHQAFCRHACVKTSQRLWARRSLFCLRHYRLLVTEVFLPSCARPSVR
ncbi:chorismate lyase [Methylophilus sp. 14]|uniref:chorismate--pyruvate lyase family protein n=1 Tax=Methylophilus sp. 14 TaxID=2781019 RepID=UPI00188E8BF8|nr:chorismate lyase [Methylophilus sp. 14]MBF4987715.1 chorismate lyase [Methylophilus sp. 14]